MGEVLLEGTFESIIQEDGSTLYVNVCSSDFSRVLTDLIAHEKFARVNNILYAELHAFNQKEGTKRRREPKKFIGKLAEAKRAEKYHGKDDEGVLLRDRKKPLSEIRPIRPNEANSISNTLIAYSQKNMKRILGFGYLSHDKKPRVFIRYSTLSKYPSSAEKVIFSIRTRLELSLSKNENISE